RLHSSHIIKPMRCMDMGSGQVFDFGLRLRKLRENKHLSQEELGKRVGVTKGSIYRYENNVQSPSLETARKLAVVLGTTLDNLAGLEDGVVIRLPNLSEAEEAALREFIRRFIS
ncbi:MAG: helix-turn-helix transcriptional regulator, partial [Dysosmobacter sp.]|nr:helix-turn-helix transcriptional regulator [Dysosmobacter sp.]